MLKCLDYYINLDLFHLGRSIDAEFAAHSRKFCIGLFFLWTVY